MARKRRIDRVSRLLGASRVVPLGRVGHTPPELATLMERISPAKQRRLDTLLERQSEDRLGMSDRRELTTLVGEAERQTLKNARALVKARGAASRRESAPSFARAGRRTGMGKKIKLGRLEDLRSKNSSSRKDDEEARFALRLGYKISQLRQKLGWSQAELARRIERKLHVVLRMERGDYRAFSLETLLRIAVATKTELVIGFRQPRS